MVSSGGKKDPSLSRLFTTAVPCTMSAEGCAEFPRMRNRRGYIVGESRDGHCFKVRFAGFKHPIVFPRTFIAPLISAQMGTAPAGPRVPHARISALQTNRMGGRLKRHIWTNDHQRRLDNLLDGDRLTVTVREAIAIVGFPQFPLIQVLDDQNIKRGMAKRNPAITMDMLAPYVSHGHFTRSGPELARLLGCSYMVLYMAAKKLGIRTKRRTSFVWTEKRLALLKAHLAPDGSLSTSTAEAARLIGCTPQTVKQKLWRLKNAVSA